VLITGASSEIGRQGAAHVILVSRSGQKLSELAGEIASASSCNAVPYTCDVSDKAQVLQMAKDVLDRFGRVDIQVNNAGFAVFKTVEDLSI
jgi:short-subunit dehydrogenase